MTADTTQPRVLVRARLAVFGLFASFGLVIATWAVHLPSIKQATDVSASMMGWILLILGAGALAGMQLSGALVDRIGSGPVAVAGVAAMAIAVVPPLAVSAWSAAAVGAFFLGLATGLAEVGLNAAAVGLERAYRRPIMASFNAVFSIGNVLGAAVGAAAFGLGIGVVHTGAVVSVVALLVVGAAAAVLVGRGPGGRVGAPRRWIRVSSSPLPALVVFSCSGCWRSCCCCRRARRWIGAACMPSSISVPVRRQGRSPWDVSSRR